jgi:hypothetical protein
MMPILHKPHKLSSEMLVTLWSAARASQYSLFPPFDLTNANYTEIGNWTLRGSAFHMRSFIRLTSQGSFTGGGLCHRVPLYAREWIFEAEVSAVGGDGGREFSFLYTTELCMDEWLHFHGLAIIIHTGFNCDSPHRFTSEFITIEPSILY